MCRRTPGDGSRLGLRGRCRKAAAAAVPLVCLGLGRFFSVKAADYQEHVSEYGTHWNFFFTTALVSVLSAVLGLQVRCSGRDH